MPSPRLATIAVGLFAAEDEKLMSNLISKYFHDLLHAGVGGQMMLATAAVDPAFWMLHGYLDKMWGSWQERGPTFKKQKLGTMDGLKLPGSPPGTKYTPVDFYDLSNQPDNVRVCYSSQMSNEEAEFKGAFTAAGVPRSETMRNFSPEHLVEIMADLDEDELKQFSWMMSFVTGLKQHSFKAMPNDCLWMNVNGSLVARPGLPEIYKKAALGQCTGPNAECGTKALT